MPDIQGGYTERHDVAQLGMIADSRPHVISSFTYEGVAKTGFGLALMYGSIDNAVDIGGTVFAGLIVSTQVIDPAIATDQYAPNDSVGLMTKGSMWVKPTTIVANGDPVYFTLADGTIQNAAAAGRVLIDGAVFETSAAANALARVHLK